RPRSFLGVLLLVAAAIVGAMSLMVAPAAADQVNVDEYDYRVSGNVKLAGQALEGVRIVVAGNGYEVEVETDAEGRWAVGVPEKAEYTVTLDESTLPEGIAVVDETGADDSPNVKEVTIGPSGRVTMNFFIGAGERNTTSFLDQLIGRIVNGRS